MPNKSKLLQTNKEHSMTKIISVCKGPIKKVYSSKAGGLYTLYLCFGAKVMLTINLCVEFGLYNNCHLYQNGRSNETLPDAVIVIFPMYSGPLPLLTRASKTFAIFSSRKDCVCVIIANDAKYHCASTGPLLFTVTRV